MLEDDRVARGEALRAGRVIRAQVLDRVQPRPGFHPCTLRIVAEQNVLRVRRGTGLQLGASNIVGRVEAIATDAGRTISHTRCPRRRAQCRTARPGDTTEWSEPAPADLRIPKGKIYGQMARAQDPRVYGATLPDASPLKAGEDLIGRG